MSNTFNYSLSDFVFANLPGNYGSDFIISGRSLICPLSSSWMNNITSIRTSVPGLCSLDLSYADKLSAVTITDNTIVDLKLPSTNNFTLCSVNINLPTISLSGINFESIIFNTSSTLRTLNLSNAFYIRNLILLNAPNLSAVSFSPISFSTAVRDIQVMIIGCGLNEQSMDNLWFALSSGTTINFTPSSYINAFVTVFNDVTASSNNSSWANQVRSQLSQRGITFNIVQTGLFNGMIFATKL